MKKHIVGCTGKIPYFSEKAARSAIKNNKHTKGQDLYHCKHCGNWHTTRMAKNVYKMLKKKRKEKNMDNSSDIKNVTLDQLVDSAVKAQSAIEELQGSLKMVKDELRDRLTAMKISGTKVNNWYVSKIKLITFPEVPMSKAEELGCTMTKIDQTKLKSLFLKGIKLPHKVTEFVKITEAKKNE